MMDLVDLVEGAVVGTESVRDAVECIAATMPEVIADHGLPTVWQLARALVAYHGGDPGPPNDATDLGRETTEARQAREAQERRDRAARARVEASRAPGDIQVRRELLRLDSGARAELAERFDGAEVGLYWRRMTCPGCGRPAVYWHVDHGGARCQHATSCGWWGSLHDYEVAR